MITIRIAAPGMVENSLILFFLSLYQTLFGQLARNDTDLDRY